MQQLARPAANIQSVERAAHILVAAATPKTALTVGEVARMLKVHKSTASRLVGTLMNSGLLEPGKTREGIQPGPQLRRIGRLSVGGADLADIASDKLDELAQLTGESTTLAIATGTRVTTIAQSQSRFAVGMTAWVGARSPLHCTSDGKVLLAFEAAELGSGPFIRSGDGVQLTRAEIETELHAVAQRGWATSIGEFEPGLNGVAVPILTPEGRCLAALCVSGPQYRVPEERLAELAEHCLSVATEITELHDAYLRRFS